MRVVARFEADLLRILSFFLGRLPVEQALPLLAERRPRPKCLSRDAVELARQTLARGCVRLLARGGGWRKERHLRGDRVAEGRLWQRTPPAELGLAFSENTLRFLIWVTAGRPRDDWRSTMEPLTVADLLLLYFAYGALRGTPSALARDRPPFATHGLCRLAYPVEFQAVAEVPDYAPWLAGLGACILEALQPVLTEHWVREELDQARVTDWEAARRQARARDRALTPFLDAVEAADRRDLARFLLPTATTLLAESRPAPWGAALKDAGPRLADRLETYRQVLFFPRQLDRLQGWQRRAQGVGYVDEGYAEAQLWKADWERWDGDALHARAQAAIRRLEPLNVS